MLLRRSETPSRPARHLLSSFSFQRNFSSHPTLDYEARVSRCCVEIFCATATGYCTGSRYCTVLIVVLLQTTIAVIIVFVQVASPRARKRLRVRTPVPLSKHSFSVAHVCGCAAFPPCIYTRRCMFGANQEYPLYLSLHLRLWYARLHQISLFSTLPSTSRVVACADYLALLPSRKS